MPPMPNYTNYVPVAQLDRVLASDAKGCEFEPRRVRQYSHMKERATFRLRTRIKTS